jgi:uncharacterized protein YjiS (DUF1127 family)
MVLVLGSGRSRGRTARRRKSLSIIARLRWLIDLMSTWRRDAANRRYLATLNEYNLKDLGLSRHDLPPDSSPPFRLW